jgi:hypothetical protein
MPTPEKLAMAIPDNVKLTDEESRAVIEIAAIAVGIDRAIHRAEVAGLQKIAARLGKTAEAEFSSLYDKLGVSDEKAAVGERIRGAAARLASTTSREVAYRAAVAITLADDEAHAKEIALHADLASALSLSKDDTARLSAEVTKAVEGD